MTNQHRRITSSKLALVVASVSLLSPMTALAQDGSADPAASADEASGPVITVTARKREENLLETPIAISAFSTDDLEKRGITSITDLVENTPGVNVTSVNSGRSDRSFQQISLRGFTPSTTSSTLTASFIDGVPVASATALNSVFDPQRIEILKGPQNAYFGRNAFAGAINIVTKEAADTFGASVSAEWTNRNGYDLSAAVEGPVIPDLLAFRITGRAFGTDGSYVNGFNANETLGDQSTRSVTGQLTFEPTSSLKIKAFGLYSEDKDGPSPDGMVSAYEVRAVNGGVNIPYFSGNTNGTVVIPGQSNCILNGYASGNSPSTEARVSRPFICGRVPGLVPGFSPSANTTVDPILARSLENGLYRVVSPGEGTQGYGLVREYRHAHLSIDWDIGDTDLTLSSLTGYNNEFYSQLDDLDNYDGSLFKGSLPGNPNTRQYFTFPFMVERNDKDFSQEVRMSYDNRGPLSGLLGVSYLQSTFVRDLTSVYTEEQFNSPRSPGSLTAPGRSETWGIFGSASFDVTDALNLSLEGRYQIDKIFAKAGGRGLTVNPARNPYNLPEGTFDYGDTIFTETYKNFLPRAIVSFDINPDAMVYASFAKAVNVSISSFNTTFLSGSPAELAAAQSIGLGIVQQPEKLDNYEAGFKGAFFNGRVRTTLAAFYAIWKDQYNVRSTAFIDTTVNPPVPMLVTGVANAGKSVIKGLELDVWAEPADGLVFTFGGAINDSSIKSFSDPAITKYSGFYGDDFKGNQLALTSKYSFNTSLQYGGDVSGWDDTTWFARTDLNWKSKQYVDPTNLTWIKGREQVNARIGFDHAGFKLEAFVTNLLNNKDFVSVAESQVLEPSFRLSTAGYNYLTVALPELRTFGIKAGYSF